MRENDPAGIDAEVTAFGLAEPMEQTPAEDTQALGDQSAPGASSESEAARWGGVAVRIIYVVFLTAAVVFSTGWFVATLVEAHGPSETERGRVLSRDAEEYTARVCSGPGTAFSRFCRREQRERFTVIGEREDGTAWLVTAEPAHEAVRQGDEVDVTTSSITDRVVRIENTSDGRRQGDNWQLAFGELYWVAAGVFVGVAAAVVALERSRRRRQYTLLNGMSKPYALGLLPGVLLGAWAVWQINYSDSWGLDVPTAVDEFGGFIAEPFDFQPRTTASQKDVVVSIVTLNELAESARAGLSNESGRVLAVPVVAVTATSNPLRWYAVDEGTQVLLDDAGRIEFDIDHSEPIDCPSTLIEFPTRTSGDRAVGFVCFDASAIDGDLYVVIVDGFLSELAKFNAPAVFAD